MMTAQPAAAMAAAVTVPYRVRFEECGADGAARSSVYLRYAQDVAWIDSEQKGYTREWYASRELGWVVRAVELAILEPLTLGQVVHVATAVTGFRRVWSRRRCEVSLDGRLVAWVHTDWVMLDLVRGLPGRVPAEFPAAFAVPPGPFEPGRVPLPATPPGAVRHPTGVRPQDLDPMGHVNNAVYVDYLEEALAVAGPDALAAVTRTPRRLRVEYLVSAEPGAELVGEAWPEDGGGEEDGGEEDARGWAWRLAGVDGRDMARARMLIGV